MSKILANNFLWRKLLDDLSYNYTINTLFTRFLKFHILSLRRKSPDVFKRRFGMKKRIIMPQADSYEFFPRWNSFQTFTVPRSFWSRSVFHYIISLYLARRFCLALTFRTSFDVHSYPLFSWSLLKHCSKARLRYCRVSAILSPQ